MDGGEGESDSTALIDLGSFGGSPALQASLEDWPTAEYVWSLPPRLQQIAVRIAALQALDQVPVGTLSDEAADRLVNLLQMFRVTWNWRWGTSLPQRIT